MQRHVVQKAKTPRNWWKWGFLTLVALLVIVLITLRVKAMGTTKVASTAKPATDTTNINVTLNKKQVNALADYYVNKSLKGQSVKYRFQVTDDAILTGSTQVLGANVNFVLLLKPTVLSSGDVQLKAEKLSVGSLPVPVSFVMSYVAKNYPLPKWVSMDSHKKIATLHLTAIGDGKKLSYAAKKIDLSGPGKFVFQARIPD
ncbi:YpmS family protein [Levilactobacillus tujiorum]|uniref:YpmS family protein n=1 Tax=Levilactobacillus tujiorum TaxID=2912243 RepID=A0ABX1L0S1_9LACO|nr:YpmS family protein [Levilactobacillus tujiorum]MCH5463630.1 YpmS family protein [Levilactobacillus tujiorum]NLR10836.1 YpmS family protein [Lactobacillus sp. HBUAS51387]NLR28618.1 YpmS family protein [Levilactobacillus tujiorum]